MHSPCCYKPPMRFRAIWAARRGSAAVLCWWSLLASQPCQQIKTRIFCHQLKTGRKSRSYFILKRLEAWVSPILKQFVTASPGRPGRDSIRRQFQKELLNCLKHNPQNYLKLLSDYNITPSEQAIARAETGLSNVIVFGLRLLQLFAHLSFLQPIPQPWATAAMKKNLCKVSFRQ
jgi:hypothetical protein